MARSKNFHERFAEAPVALPSERSTGLVFAAVAAIIAGLYRAEPAVLFVAVSIAALLAVVSFAVPQVLRPLNIAWFKFAMLLSRVVNPIVMLALFTIAIVPFGLVMQLGYDPLRRRRKANSYWIPRDGNGPPANMENQF